MSKFRQIYSQDFSKLTIHLFFLNIIFPTIILYGQESTEPLDIYDSMDRLWFSLNKLQKMHPIKYTANTLLLEIGEVFWGYELIVNKISDDTLQMIANLPSYLGVLSSKLSFIIFKDQNNDQIIKYVSPLKMENGIIVYDDSVTVDTEGDQSISSYLYKELDKKIHLYRTIGLPELFRPEIQEQNTPVTLYYHSRHVDSLKYDFYNKWVNTIHNISIDKLVYAGPISIIREEDIVTFRFYLAITTPEAFGLHFLMIDEGYKYELDHYKQIDTVVHFFPYVRVDNLFSLYGEYSQREDIEQYPIKINNE